MINITIKTKNNEVKQMIFKGHAMYDTYGKDIVCAGVSTILTTTINALLRLDDESILYEEKEPFVLTVKKWDHVAKVLIENMIDLLKELSSTYPQNIKIKEEEEQ